MEFLAGQDPEVGAAVQAEYDRQRRNIELIASENFVSPAVLAAAATVLTNKYAEGYPGKRYYGGCQCVDVVEDIARKRACQLFGADHANVQPHCGANANYAVYAALCEHGDTVLGMDLANGGHLTHGSPVNFSGKTIISWLMASTTRATSTTTRCAIWPKAQAPHAPGRRLRLSPHHRLQDLCRYRPRGGRPICLWIWPISLAWWLWGSTLPGALCRRSDHHYPQDPPRPRGGMILCKEALAKKIDSAIFPGSQGGPLEHIIAAKAVALGEAMKPEFKAYQEQILKNAAALAKALMAEGFDLVSGGTDNHLMLVDLRPARLTGKEMERRLDEVNITVNKNAIPNDPEKPFVTSGIRVGTPAATTRGFKEADMEVIASIMWRTATDFEGRQDELRAQVAQLTGKYPLYE